MLSRSPTYTVPSAATAIPVGKLKLAAVPVAFALPVEPEPASVVTTPAAVIFRIVLERLSATYTVPSAPTATPSGLLNVAAAPVPSALPAAPEPASVVTTPAAVIFRILLAWSAT